MLEYAKAIVGITGASVTAALGLIPPSSTIWILLTILSVALTASGVYLVPNKLPDVVKAKM